MLLLLHCRAAALTGEAMPVLKSTVPSSAEKDPLQWENICLAVSCGRLHHPGSTFERTHFRSSLCKQPANNLFA